MTLLQAEPFAEGLIFPEGPKWGHGRLWVSDVFDLTVHAIGPDGRLNPVCAVPHRPSGLGFLPDGTLIIVSSKDRRLLRYRDGGTTLYADLSQHTPYDVNDFAVDAEGRLYVGNFGYDYDAGEARQTTALHRVDPDGSVTEVATGVEFPNGSAVIDGGRTLVVAETWAGRLTAFDLAPDGTLGRRRIFADLGNRHPDGICADAEGAVWTASFNTGEFLRVLDGGRVTHRFQFDGRGVSCALGGADGRQLFLTTFLGPVEAIAAGKRRGAIFQAIVETPAA